MYNVGIGQSIVRKCSTLYRTKVTMTFVTCWNNYVAILVLKTHINVLEVPMFNKKNIPVGETKLMVFCTWKVFDH